MRPWAPFDQLPAIARRIAEAGVDGAVAVHGLLRELHAAGAHPVVGGAAVVDDQHERRHGALGHHLAQGLRGRRVEHRRLRREQAELERRLVRVLHRQPAIVAVPRVGVDAEPELFDIELEALRPDRGHTDRRHRHPGSWDLRCFGALLSRRLPPPLLRNCDREVGPVGGADEAGRHRPRGSCGAACSRARSSPGLSPVTSRNVRPKVPRLFQPVWNAISVIGRSVSRSSAVARSIRRVSR